MNKNVKRSLISYVLLFALIFGVLGLISNGSRNVNMSYTETHFADDVKSGKVVGVYPVDNSKKWKYFAKIAGISYVIAAAIGWMLLH